jgi:hypothetical protein
MYVNMLASLQQRTDQWARCEKVGRFFGTETPQSPSVEINLVVLAQHTTDRSIVNNIIAGVGETSTPRA